VVKRRHNEKKWNGNRLACDNLARNNALIQSG
jgi:hypothetical protein